MMPIVAVDAAATSAVWMGAYTKKLGALQGAYVVKAIQADNQHHQEAVDYADSVVKQSTPDYDPSSRSGILRAQNAYRLVNNVSSAITLFAQRHKYMYTARSKGKVSLSQLARFEMYYTLLPALAVFLLLALARGFFTDDDEGQGLVKLFVSTGFDFASMRLPIFGSLTSDAALSALNLNDGSSGRNGIRTALDAPIDMLNVFAGRGGRAVWQDQDVSNEQLKRLAYGVGDIVSFIARMPLSRKFRDAGRGYDQWQRGEGTPFSLIMPRPGK